MKLDRKSLRRLIREEMQRGTRPTQRRAPRKVSSRQLRQLILKEARLDEVTLGEFPGRPFPPDSHKASEFADGVSYYGIRHTEPSEKSAKAAQYLEQLLNQIKDYPPEWQAHHLVSAFNLHPSRVEEVQEMANMEWAQDRLAQIKALQ